MIKLYSLIIIGYLFLTKLISQPNILWIVSEDNSPLIGCYGDSLAITPNIDQLAKEGVLFENAMATAPQCAPARFSIITGIYSNSMGTENMRSEYPIPQFIKFFPRYLREAGYYTSNNSKKDYNTVDQPEAWNESSSSATYKKRPGNQPFFSIFNITVSHESRIHNNIPIDSLIHDPHDMVLAPYHPDIPEMRHDYAQYYDKITEMDQEVGEILDQLEEDGLKEETIIFYYSDHGGVLPRSKGYLFESGLRVPFIIVIPEKYQQLFPPQWVSGYRSSKLISFVDLAPTILDLAGIEVPKYMRGKSILNTNVEKDYSFSFRGRSGEPIDLSRSVRSTDFRYTLNLMPYLIYGQYNEYRWRASSMKAWEKVFNDGQLDTIQSAFFNEKPFEELYHIPSDPDNINNLAEDTAFFDVLVHHRQACLDWMLEIHDVGIVPEGLLQRYLDLGIMPSEIVRNPDYPYRRIFDLATSAGRGSQLEIEKYIELLNDEQPEIRYWAAIGLRTINVRDPKILKSLTKLKNDPVYDVKVIIANIFIENGSFQDALEIIREVLVRGNELERVHALHLIESLERPYRLQLKNIIRSIARTENVAYYDKHLANILLKKRRIFD